MLSVEENELLTKVGAGTPMGDLLRRYWHPVAAGPELRENPTKSVRIMGENLVLYRDRSGQLGLIEEACAHRRISMLYGIPEVNGLRCSYHGWLYDETGQCLETPMEAPDSTFAQRVRIKAYPVQELGGLIFAYLGPEPVPLLPRWEWLVEEHAYRQVNIMELPANWLQCMENSLDSTHSEYLHGHYANYIYERKGAQAEAMRKVPHNLRVAFDIFEHGIIKRRIMEGETEDSADWQIGHPVLFPNILSGPNQFRVPIDDGRTLHFDYTMQRVPEGIEAPEPDDIQVYYPPLHGDDARILTDYTFAQDYMAWVTQGTYSGGVAERNLERLAESDKGIILYRRLLKEQMQLVADGGEPMNVFRDAAKNVCIELPNESKGLAQGLTSIRKTRHQRRPDRETPPWINPEPWAGNGFRIFMREKVPAGE